jgi:hypothetical protein
LELFCDGAVKAVNIGNSCFRLQYFSCEGSSIIIIIIINYYC